jgi:hypothetical protein
LQNYSIRKIFKIHRDLLFQHYILMQLFWFWICHLWTSATLVERSKQAANGLATTTRRLLLLVHFLCRL